MSFEFTIPVPTTEKQALWFMIGFLFARAFGKKMDQEIQKSEWFKGQPKLVQWLVKRTLDFLHHFWIGLLLSIYAVEIATGFATIQIYIDPEVIAWFAYGVFLDDLPDVPKRFRGYFSYLFS